LSVPKDNVAYLREWGADIRKHSGKSVDADRCDAIADEIARLRARLSGLATDEMIELGAEALCNEAERVKSPGTIWNTKSDERQAMYRRYTGAVLKAALGSKRD
jgi:hypothetical protein